MFPGKLFIYLLKVIFFKKLLLRKSLFRSWKLLKRLKRWFLKTVAEDKLKETMLKFVPLFLTIAVASSATWRGRLPPKPLEFGKFFASLH